MKTYSHLLWITLITLSAFSCRSTDSAAINREQQEQKFDKDPIEEAVQAIDAVVKAIDTMPNLTIKKMEISRGDSDLDVTFFYEGDRPVAISSDYFGISATKYYLDTNTNTIFVSEWKGGKDIAMPDRLRSYMSEEDFAGFYRFEKTTRICYYHEGKMILTLETKGDSGVYTPFKSKLKFDSCGDQKRVTEEALEYLAGK